SHFPLPSFAIRFASRRAQRLNFLIASYPDRAENHTQSQAIKYTTEPASCNFSHPRGSPHRGHFSTFIGVLLLILVCRFVKFVARPD
ncbi:MAG: hypothetical protein ABFC56_10435, partial [Clostridiaceae bacterium]